MKVSEQWLRELVNPSLTIEEIAEKLTFAGVELDGIEPIANAFTNVVVGQIDSVEQHADADRLKICQVNVGADEPIQIVTNVAIVVAGQKVPVALVGANLPEADGSSFKIKKSKLRGELSQGMFCGAETLGIDDDSEGLLEIPEDALLGAGLRDVLDLSDKILDLDITPNRADCLCMIGIAREVGVLTETDVTDLQQPDVDARHDQVFTIDIQASNACKRYVGRIITGVDTKAETPEWMVQKLKRAGLNSLSPVVDITNFVLLELGQPMHAFDLDKLQKGIQVRMAKEAEKLELLDGNTVNLKADSLVIADDSGAIALAGIMGGLSTSVTDETHSVFLESAFFEPAAIAGKARSYGLHTDSSHRFERGVAPDLQVRAINRATQLVLDICGGEPGLVVDVLNEDSLLDRRAIDLRVKRISKVLGIDIPEEKVLSILQRLGCVVTDTTASGEAGWQVTPPVFRFDIALEIDLIEELARINGYDQIPASLRKMTPLVVQSKETEVELNVFHKVLTSRDYQEVVSYSFVDEEIEKLLSPDHEALKLANPISAELSVMRTTLWSGLLKTVDYNLKRQQGRVRIFETGLTFVKTDNGLVQRKKISGAITGSVLDSHWSQASVDADFFDIKGDVEALLVEAVGDDFIFEIDTASSLYSMSLHPGQSAKIVSGEKNREIGWIGALHPQLEKKLGFDQSVFLFELDIESINSRTIPAYTKVSAYPAIKRDLALLVNDNVSFADIENVIKKSELVQLVDYSLFDLYTGKGVSNGQKSLALSLIFQDVSRTLEETEITVWTKELVSLLEKQTGAALRT